MRLKIIKGSVCLAVFMFVCAFILPISTARLNAEKTDSVDSYPQSESHSDAIVNSDDDPFDIIVPETPRTVALSANENPVNIPYMASGDGTVFLETREVLRSLGMFAFYQGKILYIVDQNGNVTTFDAVTSILTISGEEKKLSVPSLLCGSAVYAPQSFFSEIPGIYVGDDLVLHYYGKGELIYLIYAISEEKYFDASKLERYINYHRITPEISFNACVALVNSGADKKAYEDICAVDLEDDLLVLPNKTHYFDKNYKPDDLTRIGSTSYLLRAEAANAYWAMRTAAAEEDIYFRVVSTYRSYSMQNQLYRNALSSSGSDYAERSSAHAGFSEHQSGLALDIIQSSFTGSLSSSGFEETENYAWLTAHAHEYGFILRYSAVAEHITGFMYEPWHWRYVGVDAAQEIWSRSMTLEEYCGYRYDYSSLR